MSTSLDSFLSTDEIISQINAHPVSDIILADNSGDRTGRISRYILGRCDKILLSECGDYIENLSGLHYHRGTNSDYQGLNMVGTDQLIMPKHFHVEELSIGDEAVIERFKELGEWENGLQIRDIWQQVKGAVEITQLANFSNM